MKTKNLEEMLEGLEQLIVRLEAEESLEKSFALYAEGLALISQANACIDKVEKEVKILDEQ